MGERITMQMLKQATDAVGGGVRGMLLEKAILKGAFDVVADKEDWRAPIDAVVDPSTCEYDADVIAHAIAFFTGTIAEFFAQPCGEYSVRAIGYRGGPAGP